MKKVLFILTLLATSFAAMADDDGWEYVGSSVVDIDFYVHKDVIRSENGYIVWVKQVLPKPEKSEIEGKTYDTRYVLNLFDNNFLRIQVLQMQEFLRDDLVASRSYDFSQYDWEYMRPDSMATAIAKYVKKLIIGKQLRFEKE